MTFIALLGSFNRIYSVFFIAVGGYRSQLLHIKNVRPSRSDEQGLVGEYRADGQGESEDPRDSVQHTQTSSGKSANDVRGDFLDIEFKS